MVPPNKKPNSGQESEMSVFLSCKKNSKYMITVVYLDGAEAVADGEDLPFADPGNGRDVIIWRRYLAQLNDGAIRSIPDKNASTKSQRHEVTGRPAEEV